MLRGLQDGCVVNCKARQLAAQRCQLEIVNMLERLNQLVSALRHRLDSDRAGLQRARQIARNESQRLRAEWVKMRDPAAFVVRGPDIERVAAQLRYHFFRREFCLAALDEHDPNGGEQAHAIARLPTAAAQPLRRRASLL